MKRFAVLGGGINMQPTELLIWGRVLAQDERYCHWESLDPSASCSRCAQGEGCGAALFSGVKRFKSRDTALRHLAVGSVFLVTLPRKALLPLCFYHYGLPLLGFFLALIITSTLSIPYQIMGAVLGLLLGMMGARYAIAACLRQQAQISQPPTLECSPPPS